MTGRNPGKVGITVRVVVSVVVETCSLNSVTEDVMIVVSIEVSIVVICKSKWISKGRLQK